MSHCLGFKLGNFELILIADQIHDFNSEVAIHLFNYLYYYWVLPFFAKTYRS